jgi:hypothetical protein
VPIAKDNSSTIAKVFPYLFLFTIFIFSSPNLGKPAFLEN